MYITLYPFSTAIKDIHFPHDNLFFSVHYMGSMIWLQSALQVLFFCESYHLFFTHNLHSFNDEFLEVPRTTWSHFNFKPYISFRGIILILKLVGENWLVSQDRVTTKSSFSLCVCELCGNSFIKQNCIFHNLPKTKVRHWIPSMTYFPMPATNREMRCKIG